MKESESSTLCITTWVTSIWNKKLYTHRQPVWHKVGVESLSNLSQVCPPGQSSGTNSACPFSAVPKDIHDRCVQDQTAVQMAGGQGS